MVNLSRSEFQNTSFALVAGGPYCPPHTQASSVFAGLANKLRKPLAEKEKNITATKSKRCQAHTSCAYLFADTLLSKAAPKPANVTAPPVTTLTKANLEAINTSLSATTRENTAAAGLSVASTRGHCKRKADEEEKEVFVLRKSRNLLC